MKSGSVYIETNGNVSVNYLSDGNYCANGEIDNLTIGKTCASIDDSEATINDDRIIIENTTNSITIKLLEEFAVDTISGIKEYKITVYNTELNYNETKTSEKIGEFKFENLKTNEAYNIKITVTNGNDFVTEYTTIATT